MSDCVYPEEFKINDVALSWKDKGYKVVVLTLAPTYSLGKVQKSEDIVSVLISISNEYQEKSKFNIIGISVDPSNVGAIATTFKNCIDIAQSERVISNSDYLLATFF